MKVSENFSRSELACKHCGWMHLTDQFIARLQRVRTRFGKPMVVNSGYRCPTYNMQVSNTGPAGPHTKGAVDIRVYGHDALKLVQIALDEGFTGIGVKQHGPQSGRFIHLDDLPNTPNQPRSWIWSY